MQFYESLGFIKGSEIRVDNIGNTIVDEVKVVENQVKIISLLEEEDCSSMRTIISLPQECYLKRTAKEVKLESSITSSVNALIDSIQEQNKEEVTRLEVLEYVRNVTDSLLAKERSPISKGECEISFNDGGFTTWDGDYLY